MTSTSEELRKIQIEDDVDRIELFGNMDANLNLIKEHTGTDIFQRDNCHSASRRTGGTGRRHSEGADGAA